MEENKDITILDFNEMVDWIQSETNYEKEVIEHILEMETEWLKQAGVVIEDGIPAIE